MFLFSLLMILNVVLQSDSFGWSQIVLGGGFLGITIYSFVQFMNSPDHFISFNDQEIKYCFREHKKPVSILRKNISNVDIELDVIHVTMADGQKHSINIIEVIDYKKRMRIKDYFRAVQNVA
jgi:hypothetical protein